MDGDCDGFTVGIFVDEDIDGHMKGVIEGENVGCADH